MEQQATAMERNTADAERQIADTKQSDNDTGEGWTHQPTASAARFFQSAIRLDIIDDDAMHTRFASGSRAQHLNTQENGVLHNPYRDMRHIDVDTSWSFKTWQSKARKKDMRYLLESAGEWKDDMSHWTGIQLAKHMEARNNGGTKTDVAGKRQETVISKATNDATLLHGEADSGQQDEGGKSASLEATGPGDDDENDSTLVEEPVPEEQSVKKKGKSIKKSSSNTKKKAAMNPETQLSIEEAEDRLFQIKRQALLDDQNAQHSDYLLIPMSDDDARTTGAFKRITFLCHANGQFILSDRIQGQVRTVLRNRDVIRNGPATGEQDAWTCYKAGVKDLVKGIQNTVGKGVEGEVRSMVLKCFPVWRSEEAIDP